MRRFLETFVTLRGDEHEAPSWDKLNQGHILELLSGRTTEAPEGAEVAFGEDTTSSEVSALIERATRA